MSLKNQKDQPLLA